jgi:hypothetical protein
MQLRSSDQDCKNTKRCNEKHARREVFFILRSAFLCCFLNSKIAQNKPQRAADPTQCAAMHSRAPQCAAMRRTATILAPSANDARRPQRCGVVSHRKDCLMLLRKSPNTVRNGNVYICRQEPTCVSSRQHLYAVLTCASKGQRRLHLQANAGFCRSLYARADSRQHVPSLASKCRLVQTGASIRLRLQTERCARPEGAPCR